MALSLPQWSSPFCSRAWARNKKKHVSTRICTYSKRNTWGCATAGPTPFLSNEPSESGSVQRVARWASWKGFLHGRKTSKEGLNLRKAQDFPKTSLPLFAQGLLSTLGLGLLISDLDTFGKAE